MTKPDDNLQKILFGEVKEMKIDFDIDDIRVCVFVCVYTYICIYVYNYIYIYIYIYIYKL